jgi:redox-sensitive bicupin YhaK (pirin superfamily)
MQEDFIISGRLRDLGGFSVHRSLPSPQKRQLGPFVFLDHMGPVKVDKVHAMDVRPHPHIGLATVTYLFDGKAFHRDSLGSKQEITPGDLNWMTAGKGIVHSERTPPEERSGKLNHFMHGVQIWVGLPKEHEECDPHFVHWPKTQLPDVKISENLNGKLLIGEFANQISPVKVLMKTLFLDIQVKNRTRETLSFMEKELGLFLISGQAIINGHEMQTDDLIVVSNPLKIQVELSEGARLIAIGGDPFPEPRYIWWNFVSTRKERIHQAARDWKNQSMGQVVDETEFIPLPDIPMP